MKENSISCLVTGAAGFIGSHLSERLLDLGYEVIGIDAFMDYYPRAIKEKNLIRLKKHPRFSFIEGNLLHLDVSPYLSRVKYIFHQAAQAGVRASWGSNFIVYTENNIDATQRLLEACKAVPHLEKFIYASSSSVYGDTPTLPMQEDSPLHPVSPYGVTKLAAEHLCYLYWKNFNIPTLSLRYFTVYGPRQRPDMAIHKFIKSILRGESIEVYGNGEQTRDFTFVSDAVEANILAMKYPRSGEVFNIGGGSRILLNQLIELLQTLLGKSVKVHYQATQKGDVGHTYADTSRAKRELGFSPKVGIEEGLWEEIRWMKEMLEL
jgi:nucleoside-diphosphate-sugar epimerase